MEKERDIGVGVEREGKSRDSGKEEKTDFGWERLRLVTGNVVEAELMCMFLWDGVGSGCGRRT